MTIELLKFTEEDLLDYFEEVIAPLYSRGTARTIRSILVNMAQQLTDLIPLADSLTSEELRSKVIEIGIDAGYSYSTMRTVAPPIVRLIISLNLGVDEANYYDLMESFVSSRYKGAYAKKMRNILSSLYPKMKELRAKRDLPHEELRDEVVKVLREIGYSENKARKFAGSVAIFIREVDGL